MITNQDVYHLLNKVEQLGHIDPDELTSEELEVFNYCVAQGYLARKEPGDETQNSRSVFADEEGQNRSGNITKYGYVVIASISAFFLGRLCDFLSNNPSCLDRIKVFLLGLFS